MFATVVRVYASKRPPVHTARLLSLFFIFLPFRAQIFREDGDVVRIASLFLSDRGAVVYGN